MDIGKKKLSESIAIILISISISDLINGVVDFSKVFPSEFVGGTQSSPPPQPYYEWHFHLPNTFGWLILLIVGCIYIIKSRLEKS